MTTRISLRRGLSILEVMIAVAILATALSAMIGTIFTLHQSRNALDEEIKAQAIAQIMIERLQGATWDSLGTDNPAMPNRNAWSWHRRATKQLAYLPSMDPAVTPPMQEKAKRDVDDLEKLGLLTGPSGIRELKVYLEYFQMALTDEINDKLLANPTLNSRNVWLEMVGNPYTGIGPSSSELTIYVPENPNEINFGTINGAVIMRILISWESSVGGTRWHEIVVARRK